MATEQDGQEKKISNGGPTLQASTESNTKKQSPNDSLSDENDLTADSQGTTISVSSRAPPPSLAELSSIDLEGKEAKKAVIDDYYRRQSNILHMADYINGINNARNGIRKRKNSQISHVGAPQIPPRKNNGSSFKKSFYYIASYHRKVGLRHLVVIALIFGYTCGGGLLLYLLENKYEKQLVIDNGILMENTIRSIANEIRSKGKNQDFEKNIKDAYIKLLKADGRYSGSTFWKQESDDNLLWNFNNAVFFCVNLYTTVGYGVIYCSTVLGRVLTMLYIAITMPLSISVARDLGQWMIYYLTKLYATLLIKIREARGYFTPEEETIMMPLKMSISFVFAYLFCVTLFVYKYETVWGPDGISFYDTWYFSFLTMFCIGLGSVTPTYVLYSPFVTATFFFGITLGRIVNRMEYLAMENGIFGIFALLDQKLESRNKPVDTEAPPPSVQLETQLSTSEREEEDETSMPVTALMNNNLTWTSVATMIRTRGDVYGGDYGRVALRKQDL